MTKDFELWMTDLAETAQREFGFSEAAAIDIGTDSESWRGFYDDGFTPADALAEDIFNA